MDAVDSLGPLKDGLDVNIRFTDVRSMEWTKECIVFDVLGIEILHGWLVDPQDVETTTAMSNKSYNQLMEKLIESKTAVTPKRPAAKEPAAAAATAAAQDETTGDESSQGAAEEEAPEEDYDEMERTHSQLVRDGELIDSFINDNPSQLTYYGITELHREIKEGQSVCFFRNNHYSVLHMNHGHLYNLVSDEGYARERDIVWERVEEIEGNCDFFDGRFARFTPHAAHSPPTQQQQQHGGMAVVQGTPVGDDSYDSDLAFAKQLQQQEEALARQAQKQQRGNAPRQAAPSRASAEQSAAQAEAIRRTREKEKKKKKEKDDGCNVM